MNITKLLALGMMAKSAASLRVCLPKINNLFAHPPKMADSFAYGERAEHCPIPSIHLKPEQGFASSCNFNFQLSGLDTDLFQWQHIPKEAQKALEERLQNQEQDFVRRQREHVNRLIRSKGDDAYLEDAKGMLDYVSNSSAMGAEGTLKFRQILEEYSIPFLFPVFRGKTVRQPLLDRALEVLQMPASPEQQELLRQIGYQMIHTPFNPRIHITASASTRASVAQKFMKNPEEGNVSVKFHIVPNLKNPPLGLSKDAFPLPELIADYPPIIKAIRRKTYLPNGFSICREAEISLNNLRNVYSLKKIQKMPGGVHVVHIEASGLPKGQQNPYAHPINMHEA